MRGGRDRNPPAVAPSIERSGDAERLAGRSCPPSEPADAIARLEKPLACSDTERGEFARLVRRGFEGSDEGLPGRIRDAAWLAFHYAPHGTLAGVAGLKVPGEQYRSEVFEKAGAGVDDADYELELGWVFVAPSHRGNRIGEGLCRMLMARVPGSSVFATTRPDNTPMIGILRPLGFARVGKPYPHVRRDDELTLFLRPRPIGG